MESGATESGNSRLWRVVMLALAGYAFIFLLLLIQVFLVAYCIHYALSDDGFLYYRIVGGLVAVALFVGVVHLFRAIFARSWAVKGYELPQDAPLYRAMEEIAGQIGSPAPTKIFIDHDLNASAGVNKAFLPWRKDAFVTVGVPLAAALSPQELKAVLAHELGHHSRKHSRISNWVYRVRWSWDGVDDAFEHLPHFVAWFVERFYDWFVPVFLRESFAIARANEYEADAVAASVVGAGPLASSLTRLEAIAPWLQSHYWPRVFGLAEKRPAPPEAILSHLSNSLQKLDGAMLRKQFRAVDADSTHEHDTHPSLSDRVRALGMSVEPPNPLGDSGLELFGHYRAEILDRLNQEWREAHEEQWASIHQRKIWVRSRIAELVGRQSELSIPDYEELAELYLETGDRKRAFQCFRSLYQRRRHPRDLAHCAECLARIEGQEGKARDTAAKAMGKSPEVDLDMVRLLIALTADAKERKRLAERYDEIEDIVDERDELFEEGTLGGQLKKLRPPQMTPDDYERISRHLQSVSDIVEAHLVEISAEDDYPWRQMFLFVSIDDLPDDEDEEEAVWDHISSECWLSNGEITVYDAMDELRAWANARKVKGAALVNRKQT